MRFIFVLLLITAAAWGEAVPNFRLLDTRGFSHELARHADAKGVVLVAWDAANPRAAEAAKQTAALAQAFKDAPVRFFALSPAPRGDAGAASARIETAPDPNQALLAGAQSLLGRIGLRQGPQAGDGADLVPVLRDTAATVASRIGFRGVFEALVLAPATREVLWRGPLLDGGTEALQGALEQLKGGQLTAAQAPAAATFDMLALDPLPAAPDYATEVAPILRDKCATCHRPGGAAPFAFTSHEKARSYADMIEEVLLTQQMPPWHADPAYGHFANDRSLSDAQVRTLVAWARAGAPRGAGDDPLAAVQPLPAHKWQLGEPDVVLGMPMAHALPAEGVLEYHVIKIPSGFTQDTWIRGIEVRPGNARVVHHALIFIEYPPHLKAREPQVSGGTGGFFAGFVPGAEPRFFPEGTAKYAPPGATFIFQIHYVTTGKPEEDQTEMGLYLAKEPPRERIETEAASNTLFQIPPGARDVPVTAEDGFWMQCKLWGLSPHMHYRGSRFKYTLRDKDGLEQVVLSVPNYKFDWQTMYQFSEPLLVGGRTELRCEGAFDNSVTNPYNPDPKDLVRFGDQTFQEMFIGYYEYSAPVEAWEERFARRERRMAEMKAEFDARNPGVSTAPPFTAEELVGTTWKEDDWIFSFQAGGELVVNSFIKGVWKIENQRAIIDVYGSHFELDILGKGLFFSGNYPLERIK